MKLKQWSLYTRSDVGLFRRGQEGDGRICTMECKSLLENDALILCHYTYTILILFVM